MLAICAGLTSIKFALDEKPWISLALIGAAAILDGIDGGIARALNAQSRMGAEIDSLADAVNFGVAPALVIYVTLLPNSQLGWIFVLLYAVCVVLRLARFNALLDDDTRPAYTREFFTGMPAPCGAIGAIGPLVAMHAVRRTAGGRRTGSSASGWPRNAALLVSRVPTLALKAISVPRERRADPADPGRGRRCRAAAVPVRPAAADHRRLRVHHAVHHPQPALGGGAPRGVGRQAGTTTGGPPRGAAGGAQPALGGAPGAAQARVPGVTQTDPDRASRPPLGQLRLTARLNTSAIGLPPRRRPAASRSPCRARHPGVGRGVADRFAHHRRRRRRRAGPTRPRAPPCSTTSRCPTPACARTPP